MRSGEGGFGKAVGGKPMSGELAFILPISYIYRIRK